MEPSVNTKNRCESTGVSEAMFRQQAAEWRKARRKARLPLTGDCDRMMAVGDSYVASIPPPPIPGTPDYYRCVGKWSTTFQQAQMLDTYRKMITQMQRQETDGAAILLTLAEAYTNCMTGTPA